MDSFAFNSLCREASRVLGVADLDALAQTGQINLGGVEIGLIFDEENASRLFCYVDIGSADSLDSSTIDGTAVYRDMLVLNLLQGSKTAGVVAFDPHSKRLVLSAHLNEPDSLDGDSLASSLKKYVEDSQLARELWTHRLEAISPEAKIHHLSSLA